MLLGIVKKNGIMIVDFSIARRQDGLSYDNAIHAANMSSFRPIIMTTLAALIGMVPSSSVGSGWRFPHPLELYIVGGLIFSQIITFYVTQVIYICI
jgi:HAE1 family hydrophobic/amphiphilic exporter-1